MNKIILLLLALLCSVSASAQERRPVDRRRPGVEGARQRPFVLGVVERIQSAELGEPRILNIYLPEGYAQDSGVKYPVIYLLDGSANEDFVHVAGITQFLTMIGQLPPTIVVGIANVDRRRDFTFPTQVAKEKEDFPTTGGSLKFMAFLEKELMPFIDQKYQSSSVRTIIGQSLGGLFAAELLLRKPGLFDNYIIVSPSLWWSSESLLADAPKWLKGGKFRESTRDSTRVYLTVGQEGAQMEEGSRKLADLLGASGKGKISAQLVPMPGESHLTILHNAVYRVLGMMHPLPPERSK